MPGNASILSVLLVLRPSGGVTVENLVRLPVCVLDVEGARPLEALKRLRAEVSVGQGSKEEWRQSARAAAVIGSLPRSIESFKSGKTIQGLHAFVTAQLLPRRAPLACIYQHRPWQRSSSLPSTVTRCVGVEQHLQVLRHLWELLELLASSLPRHRA